MIARRELLTVLAALLAHPLAVLAQKQAKVWHIGVLVESDPATYVLLIDGFKAGMRELGYIEGRDYVIVQRAAANDAGRLRALAAELIGLKVDLILSTGSPSAMAAHAATREIPILITTAGDPVGSGLAASLRRPGGTVTGITSLDSELISKRLDLLRQLVPGLRRVGLLFDPDNTANAQNAQQLQADCTRLGYTLIAAPVHKPEDFTTAFGNLQRDKVQGLIVSGPAWFGNWRATIVEQAVKRRLPAVHGGGRLWAEAGSLVVYAANNPALYHRAATYADKVFKGAKPGELPIEQPTKFELYINLKTAKALGLTIPPSVMVQATRVIE